MPIRPSSEFHSFPSDIILYIFGFLRLPDLNICRIVCKRWKRLSKTNSLWIHLYSELLQEIGNHPDKTEDDVDEIDSDYVDSDSERAKAEVVHASIRTLYIETFLRHQLFETVKGRGSLSFRSTSSLCISKDKCEICKSLLQWNSAYISEGYDWYRLPTHPQPNRYHLSCALRARRASLFPLSRSFFVEEFSEKQQNQIILWIRKGFRKKVSRNPTPHSFSLHLLLICSFSSRSFFHASSRSAKLDYTISETAQSYKSESRNIPIP